MIGPLCFSYVLGNPANVFTYSAYSTSTGSPVPPPHPAFGHLLLKEKENGILFYLLSVSPGGFIPDAANTSGNYL